MTRRVPNSRRHTPCAEPRHTECAGYIGACLALLLLLASPLIAADPPKLDRYGMPLPPGAIARLGDARLRHASPVTHLAFSADASRLLSVCEDQSVHVWNVKTGLPAARLPAGSAQSAALPPDGKSLVLIDPKGHFKQYDLADVRKPTRDERIEGYTGGLAVLAPDGGSFAYLHGARDEEHYHIIRIADWKVTAEIASPQPGLTREVTFSGDGKRVAFLDGSRENPRTVRVHQAVRGELLFAKTVECVDAYGLTCDERGDRVGVISVDGPAMRTSIWVWETSSGKRLAVRKAGHQEVKTAALSADGRTVFFTINDSAYFLDIASGWAVPMLSLRGWPARSAFDNGSRQVAVARDHFVVELIDLRDRQMMRRPDADFPVNSGFAVPNSTELYSGLSPYHEPRVWNLTTGLPDKTISFPNLGASYSYSLSPQTRWLAVHGHSGIHITDRQTSRVTASVPVPSTTLWISRFASDDQTAVIVQFNPPRMWRIDAPTGAILREQKLPVVVDGQVRIARDSTRVVAVETVEAADPNVLGPSYPPKTPTGLIRQWDVATGQEMLPIRWATPQQIGNKPHVRSLNELALSANGQLLVLYEFDSKPHDSQQPNVDVVIRMFETTTGRELARHHVADLTWHNTVLSPDGRFTVGCLWDGRVRIVENSTGLLRTELSGHGWVVTQADFTPDSRYLITASPDQSALVWDLWQPFSPPPQTLAEAWQAIAARSGEKAHAALAWLAARPTETVPYLAERVKPQGTITAQQVAEWIKQLDADAFREREAAEAKLRGAVRDFAKTLEDAANTTPSPEVRTRLRKLLAAKGRWQPPPEEMQALRAIEVLERIGTPAARDVLKKLAAGPAEAWVTRDAVAALERLTKRE